MLKGVNIPDNLDNIKELKINAKFVLIIEKDATLQRLLDDNFLLKYPALLVTVNIGLFWKKSLRYNLFTKGKGEPDIITRKFMNLLFKKFGSIIEFFCLTDANPFGKIFLFFDFLFYQNI